MQPKSFVEEDEKIHSPYFFSRSDIMHAQFNTDRHAWDSDGRGGFGPESGRTSTCRSYDSPVVIGGRLHIFPVSKSPCPQCKNPRAHSYWAGKKYLGCEDCTVLPLESLVLKKPLSKENGWIIDVRFLDQEP